MASARCQAISLASIASSSLCEPDAYRGPAPQTARAPAAGSVSSCAICANSGSILSAPWARSGRTPPRGRGSYWSTGCAGRSVASRIPVSISAACCSARLHRHEPHARPAHRFTQRLRHPARRSCSASRRASPVAAPSASPRGRAWRSSRAQYCEAPQASIPITVGGSLAKNASTCLRDSFLRNTGCSAASTPCSSKICFDVSIPMRIIWFTDGSLV